MWFYSNVINSNWSYNMSQREKQKFQKLLFKCCWALPSMFFCTLVSTVALRWQLEHPVYRHASLKPFSLGCISTRWSDSYKLQNHISLFPPFVSKNSKDIRNIYIKIMDYFVMNLNADFFCWLGFAFSFSSSLFTLHLFKYIRHYRYS